MTEGVVERISGQELMRHALNAAHKAYAPYSKFGVGAALLLTDGSIVSGANFENASYGLSLCAEAVALAAANVAGRLKDVVAVAIVGGALTGTSLRGDTPVYPCGRCRQMLHEAADVGRRDMIIYCASSDGTALRRHLLSDLLPYAFGPSDLHRESSY